MTNYVFSKWTILFKGRFMTSAKMMWESRSLVNNLSKADKTLYHDLLDEVEKYHKVTKAMKDEDKIVNELAVAASKGYALAFNSAILEEELLKQIHELNAQWDAIEKAAGNDNDLRSIARNYAVMVIKAARKALSEEGEEGKKIMAIINQSEGSKAADFVASMRLALKKDTSLPAFLTRRAFRTDVRSARSAIARLEKINAQIKKTVSLIKERKNAEKAKSILFAVAKESAADVEKALYSLYQIKKRDFYLMLMILYDDRVLESLNHKWAQMHFMPQSTSKKEDAAIDKLHKKISQNFHTISQSLLITSKQIKQMEGEALRLAA